MQESVLNLCNQKEEEWISGRCTSVSSGHSLTYPIISYVRMDLGWRIKIKDPDYASGSLHYRIDQGCAGVFSAKYSWLSALVMARLGSVLARFFAPAWP